MRYVSLLLIFCMAFGVLDSVPRYRGAGGMPTADSPALIARAEPSDVAAAANAHFTNSLRHKSHVIAAPALRAVVSAPRAIAAPAPRSAAVPAHRAAAPARIVVPTYHPAMDDIVHGTV